MRCFLQVMRRGIAVNRIDRDKSRSDLFDCVQPGTDILFIDVIDPLAVERSVKEHRLNDGAVSEPFHRFKDLIEMQSGIGPIHPLNVFLIHGIKLQLSVVDLEKRVKNGADA